MGSQNSNYEELIKAMRDKALEFGTHLSRVKKANDELVVKAEKACNTLHDLIGSVRPVPRKSCICCYTRDVTLCLVPCGHVLCDNCAERARQRSPARCFTCRARIESTMKIYI